MALGQGFPLRTGRPGLTEGGVALEDERRPADPRSEVGAREMSLVLWQTGGLGLLAPLCSFFYEPQGGSYTERLRFGAFAWDTANLYSMQSPPFTWFTATRNAAGDYSFDFLATAPASTGTAQAIAFQGGLAKPCGYGGAALGNLRAEVQLVDSNSIRVRVRAQPGGALTESPVVVLAW